ncbi:MAG: BREX-1 system adenine-specific DNA-methyltransferase PglX, partial [Natronincolaceae bacterium]
YETEQDNFEKIPGMPIAYWISSRLSETFLKHSLARHATCKSGIMTGADNLFTKYWFEPPNSNINFNCLNSKMYSGSSEKWFPINSGGFRKWYGNLEIIVNIQNHGHDIRNKKGINYRLRDEQFYFREGAVWSEICTGTFSARYCRNNTLFFVTAPIAIPNNPADNSYLIALLNCNVSNYIFNIINPTLHYNIGCVEALPFIYSERAEIFSMANQNILISKTDWDSFETSWDFKIHPLLNREFNFMHPDLDTGQPNKTIESAYDIWKQFANNNFNQLKSNEEELNRIFIEIYGLEDELTPEVSDKDITITKIFDTKEEIYEDIKGNRYILTKEDVIKSFISYAVGCMFGRYSLDKEGLAYAGGKFCDKWKIENGEWKIKDKDSWVKSSINIAEDNIIFITDEEYFEDDIVNRFVDFVKTVYGEEPLEENLNFIADALGGRGTPKEIIRNYFLRDFYKDHIKTYQKRPIYWQYDSGKQNGFKAIIYMHRYDEDTTGRVRVDYLHKMQKAYETAIDNLKYTVANNKNPREVAKAEKHLTRITKQLKECKDYDEKIAHLAVARIPIDLDDGVKVNYDKIQTDEKGKNLQILTKI